MHFSVKATEPDTSAAAEALLDHEVFIFSDIALNLKAGLLDLQNVKGATEISQSVKNLESQMGQNEKDALKALFKISTEAVVAIAASDNVALKLKEVVDDTLSKLNKNADATQLDLALKAYVDKSAPLPDLVSTAIDKLTVVSARSITGNLFAPSFVFL